SAGVWQARGNDQPLMPGVRVDALTRRGTLVAMEPVGPVSPMERWQGRAVSVTRTPRTSAARQITRRQFLRGLGVSVPVVALLSACGSPPAPAQPTAPAATTAPVA